MGSILRTISIAIAALATTTQSLSTLTPLTSSGPSYSIGIPSSSSVSSTSTGPLYFQIRAPISFQWVAFGIGEQMAGAKILLMYADGAGNVTVSARLAQGHFEPQNDDTFQQGVTLLAGSGVVGGEMIANIMCTSVTLETAKDSASSPFIAAWMKGSPLNSKSTSATIRQHSGDSYRQISLDLRKAALTTNANPFLATTTNPSNKPASPSASNSPNSNNDNSGVVITGTSSDTIATYQKAHGILASVAVVMLFPLGAIIMRLGAGIWIHAAIQLISLAVLTAAFATGVKLAQIKNLLEKQPHTILGTVLFALFLLQPLSGIYHHMRFVATSSRTPVSHVHIWLGRAILLVAVLNGGLGLKLADNTKGGEIAYGVVAGFMGVLYTVLVGFKRKGGAAAGAVDGGDGQGEGKKRGKWGRREKIGSSGGSE